MASTLTAKYIMGGLASMVGLSGSIYFIVKQSKNTNASSVVDSSSDTKQAGDIDIFDIVSKTFGLSLKNVADILKMLQLFEKEGHQLTMTQIEKHKDKIFMLTQLMEQCKDFKEKNPTDTSKSVCNMKKDQTDVIEKLLAHYDAIVKLTKQYEQDKKDMATLNAAETVMQASKLSASNDKNKMTMGFFDALETKLNSSTSATKTADVTVIKSLKDFYIKQQVAPLTNAPVSVP